MLPNLMACAGVRLTPCIGLLDGSERFAKLIGASIAGLLVASVGPIAALFDNAATFAVSALLTWAFVTVVPALLSRAKNDNDPPHTSYWSDLAEGFRLVSRDPLMRLIVGLVVFTNLLDAARRSTLMPLRQRSVERRGRVGCLRRKAESG